MKQQVTLYREGQIYKQVTKSCIRVAMQFAAHELGKAVKHLTLDKRFDVKLETAFLTRDEWTATITVVDVERFGITVERLK